MSQQPLVKQIRYRAARLLRKAANRLATKEAARGLSFPNIGIENLASDAPRALIIFTTTGIERYLQGRMKDDDPFWNKHTVYWESVEIARQLNAHGYIVDYADNRATFSGDWNRYALVIDGSDNLRHAPPVPNQIRIHYATYIHWLTWNQAELERIEWFKKRTGILTPMNRQLPNILSDEYADYVTYYGTQTQADSFSSKPVKRQLNISAVFVPERHTKNIAKARNNFLWLGGGGLVHKGLDLVMEAFARMPEMHLYVAGNLQDEPRFWQWAKPFLMKYPNIHSLGWTDVASPEFDAVARDCIGTVYLSAAEGGPGATAQVIHWGLIPIVTTSALVRAETLGTIVHGHTDEELISSTIQAVRALSSRSEEELQRQSDAVADFARAHHTREAYTKSFSDFLSLILKS